MCPLDCLMTKEVAILPKVDVIMHKDAVRLYDVTFRDLKWPLDFLKLPLIS